MNQSIKASIHWLSAIDMFAVSLLFTVFTAQAQPNAQTPSINEILLQGVASYQKSAQNSTSSSEMEKAIWTDPKTGLTWMRCLMDQQWIGTSCQGRPEIRNWWESLYAVKSLKFAGYNDWRLPSAQDLNGIRNCRLNLKSQATASTASGEWTYNPWCAERTKPVDVSIFAGLVGREEDDLVWSSTRSTRHLNDVYTLCYSRGCYGSTGGLLDISGKQSKDSRFPRYILAVRGGQPEGDYESALEEAKKELIVQADKDAREQAEATRIRRAQVAEATRIRLAQEAEEKSFSSILNNGNPQTMYLAAGSYERNGDGNKAGQIYQSIISKFPSSSWAVKASDQLSESKRSNDAQSAANQRQYNAQRASESAAQDAASKARSQCSYRIDKCEDSCRPLSGSSKSACWSGCKSLCNQF